ncbi:MAG: 2Fe-2S iron-sulfur cluster binding domain-containing protein [Burkholderiaceae bacterium]|nr:2Fe-2S iron-sulfur cluster binding domain-containing protein [Burkholderiaceae bacterium]
MSRALTVSRAAQLVGVSRAVLQRMIGAGELAQFDGLVQIDDLLRAFPQASLEDSGALEKVARIREEAFGRRVRERVLPSPEVLSQRLFAQSQELAEMRRHLQAYHALVAEAIERLSAQPAPAAGHTRAWLEQGLARVLGSEADNELDAMTDMLKVVYANVVVRPSGREFLVEGNDSILQAGLKAGLALNYGCNGGNCGLCKARIVSGEVRPILHADYPMSAAERAQGYVLLCTHTALGDLVIETLEAASPADIPEQQLTAKVRAIAPLGPDTLLLHLQAPRSARLRFLAGQGATLGLADAQGDLQASWPIASCPCDDRNLHFHIARDDTDALAQQLFAGRVAVGDALNVRGPHGDFVLGRDTLPRAAFLACDTGFAPVRSLIEHAIAAESVERFGLYWLATRPDGHYLANQCEAWAAAFDEFDYAALADADPVRGAQALALRAARECDPLATRFFVAGVQAFVDAAARCLLEAGVPAGALRANVC